MGLFKKKKSKDNNDLDKLYDKSESKDKTNKKHKSKDKTHKSKDKTNKKSKKDKSTDEIETIKLKYHSNKCEICYKRTIETFDLASKLPTSTRTILISSRDSNGHLIWRVESQ